MMRLAAVFFSLALLVIAAVVFLRFDQLAAFTATQTKEARAWEVLDRIEATALTTHRIKTRLDYRLEEKNVLFGSADSLIIATVEFEYGFDLSRLEENAVQVSDNLLIVRLPEPSALDIDIPIESIAYFEKTTGLIPFKDQFEDRDRRTEMAAALRRDAEALARARGLIPTEEAYRARVRTLLRVILAPLLNDGRRLQIEFGAPAPDLIG